MTQPHAFRRQRGIGSLAIALILLFAMTMIAFFVNRSQIFEQKASANQYRSTRAFEAAEAGLEWATAMINDIRIANTSCVAAGAGAVSSFRKTYLNFGSGGYSPISTVQPGCSITTTSGVPSLSCTCQTAGNPAALAGVTTPVFTVKFEAVNATTLPNGTADGESVLVTAYGCTSADARCVPGATGTADGYQKLSVILKLKPALQSVPAAALTTGGSLYLTSSASSITNSDRDTNGLLVNSGGGINTTSVAGCSGTTHDFQTTTTLTGTPWQNSMVAGDSSLATLSTNADAMFEAYFNTTLAEYQNDRGTKQLTNCGSASSDFDSAYAAGYRAFYTTCNFTRGANMGTAAAPIAFVTTGALQLNGGATLYGLIYGDQATWDAVGLGNGGVEGAMIVRGNYCANANADYNYNADVLRRIRGDTGVLIRVPGSWKDY
jgi:PilX N-terminal